MWLHIHPTAKGPNKGSPVLTEQLTYWSESLWDRFFSSFWGTFQAYNILKLIIVYLSGMNTLYKTGLFLGLFFLMGLSYGQTPAEFEANYAKRIKLEMINGVYIPMDLDDAFSELNRLSSTEGLADFKAAPENSIRRKLHFGLGRWMLINWGLEDGSRISDYLKQKGVSTPDDMVEVIIVTWHRNLNGQPLKLQEEVAIIEKRMEQEKAKRDSLKEIIILETRPHKED